MSTRYLKNRLHDDELRDRRRRAQLAKQARVPGRPLVAPDPFGVFSEAFARYMGTPAFIGWMSVSAGLEHLGSPRVGSVIGS